MDVKAILDAGTIIALVMAGISLYLARSNRTLLRADATEKLTAAAMGMIEPLEARIDELEAHERVLRNQLAEERQRRRELEMDNIKIRQEFEGQRLLSEGALELLQHEVTDLQGEVTTLRAENAELRIGVAILVEQLRNNGLHPAWEPK